VKGGEPHLATEDVLLSEPRDMGVSRDAGARVPSRVRQPRLPWPVAVLAVVSAIVAVVLSRTVFPFLSINNDEPVNRLFADAIAHGRLFPPTGGFGNAFRPWLAAVSDGHFVLKYTPVVPAFMALSLALTGGTDVYLAVVAGATVVMTFLLAEEVLGNRREALVATALVVLSPLVLIQSALLLSYLPTLFLLELFAWTLIRGLSRGTPRLLLVSGLAFGLAFFARSYDALVVGAPVALWAVLGRFGRRPTWADGVRFGVPALGALAAFLLFNQAATGNPLQPPFSLLEPDDKLGFGIRRLYPTDAPHSFGFAEGIDGFVRHGALLNLWLVGGTLLALVAAVGYLRGRFTDRAWPFLGVGFLVPLSYVIFWGPWNATVVWGGTTYVGPFYFLPVVLPLALLAAPCVVDLLRWRFRAGVALVAGMALVTSGTLVFALRANLAFTADLRALHELVSERAPRQLVFAAMPTPFLMHPTPVISNRWDLSGPVLYALERGTQDLAVVQAFPDRVPYRLRHERDFRHPALPLRARLEELRRLEGTVLDLTVRLGSGLPEGSLTLAVSARGVTREYQLGETGGAGHQRLLVDHRGPELAGRTPTYDVSGGRDNGLEVELFVRPYPTSRAVSLGREWFPLRVAGDGLELLAPTGRAWTAGRARSPAVQLAVSS
jgi:hypothetical protein